MPKGTDYYEAALREDEKRRTQRTWLEEVAGRLSDYPVLECEARPYWNRFGCQGYYACYQTKDRWGYPLWLMISRSHTSTLLTLDELLDDLRSSEITIPFEEFGEYPSRARAQSLGAKIGPGTYATIRFGRRWYMISRSGKPKPYFKLFEISQRVPRPTPLTYAKLKEMQNAARAKIGLI